MKKALDGKVALVAGATRGAGRGIAIALGEAGATVYCTGRSSRSKPRTIVTAHGEGSPFALERRPETIEETAELVERKGGKGIALRVDHTDEAQVEALVRSIREQHGRLDLVVNDVWGGDELTEWGTPFWQLSLDKGFRMLERALHSHLITARHAVPLMLDTPGGLVVEITDGDQLNYRGTLFYDLVKTSVIRLAFAMAEELRPHGVAALALTPGFLRSEAMLEHFGVTEEHWREGAQRDPHFIASETPLYVGRAVAALAADPRILEKSGGVFSSWGLQSEYGFSDANGEQPNWGEHYRSHVGDDPKASHVRFLRGFATST